MQEIIKKHVKLLIGRYPALRECEEEIISAYEVLEECFSSGHKLLVAGNGGSCADSEHIVGELMKGFRLPRKCSTEFADKLKAIDPTRGCELSEKLQGGLPSIALDGHQCLNTAVINDMPNGGIFTYAQQVYGYGKEGDVFLAISTSGNSQNVLNATVVARALGLKVIGLTGRQGGELAKVADTAIIVPQSETYIIQ